MSKKRPKLDSDDRIKIHACLERRMNVTAIAKELGFNKSTISRELWRNLIEKKAKVTSCPIRDRLIVCNTCKKKGLCGKLKRYYNYKEAEIRTMNRRVSSRSKPKLNGEAIKLIDEIVSEGVRLGQSLHHIYQSDPHLQSLCSERTIRRYVYRGILGVKRHQLRRYVRFKHSQHQVDQVLPVKDVRVLLNRTFKDFNRHVASNKRQNIVEFDSVVGKREDRQAILTLTFKKYNFQFGLLIKKGNSDFCVNTIKNMFKTMGDSLVKSAFPICLCDNGTEFARFHEIELNSLGEQLLRTFFTTPYRSTDKASCERNHGLVRYVFPKGISLNSLTQEMVDDAFSNINSYIRESKGNQTPYDLVRAKFGQSFLDKINIKRIPNKKVKLLSVI